MAQSGVVPRRILNVLALLALVVLSSACRVDLAVEVAMDRDATGTVTVTATADEDVVERTPGLAQDLRTADLESAGWTVTGPSVTDDGGLTVTVSRPFATVAEANAILASLNGADGPFQRVQLARTQDDDAVTFTLDGVGRANSGVAIFTDPDLLAAVGATPYVDEIAAAGMSPTEAVGITFRADLPGDVEASSVDPEAESDDLQWTIPLDGSSVALTATTTVSLADDPIWSVVATVLLVVLVVWLAVAAAFIALVVRARRRRMRRGRSTPTPAEVPGSPLESSNTRH